MPRVQEDTQESPGSYERVSKPRAREFAVTSHLPEYQASSNAADATKSNKSRTAERTLPLASDVVALVRHALGNVGVCACASEEDTKVSNAEAVDPAHHGEPDDAKDCIEDEEGSPDMVLEVVR